MSEVERRLSVQEKIEQLEKNKITLHPPIFDSKINMSAEGKSPDADPDTLEGHKTTIRVIKTNEAENVKVELSLGGKNTTGLENNDSKVNNPDGNVKDADNKRMENVKESSGQRDDFQEGEKRDEGTEKDADTEKETDNKIETLDEDKPKIKKETEDSSAKKKEPLVPLTDAEIDKIVDKYPRLRKDEKALQRYLDFFFSMDRPKYGYFTMEMLIYKLHQDRVYLPEEEIARIFCDLDADHDLLVSLDEYLAEMSKPTRRHLSTEELKDWFESADLDKDGFLSRNDIENSLQRISRHAPSLYLIDDMLSWDKTGMREKLDFEDFSRAFKNGGRSYRTYSNEDDWFTALMPKPNSLTSRI